LARDQFVQRPHAPLSQLFPLGISNRTDFDSEFKKDFKAGLKCSRSGRQPRMNRAFVELAANLLYTSA
jgi:hypothetical protein